MLKRKDGCFHDCNEFHVLMGLLPDVFSKLKKKIQLCFNQHACVEQ